MPSTENFPDSIRRDHRSDDEEIAAFEGIREQDRMLICARIQETND